jgi:hypothetical protein
MVNGTKEKIKKILKEHYFLKYLVIAIPLVVILFLVIKALIPIKLPEETIGRYANARNIWGEIFYDQVEITIKKDNKVTISGITLTNGSFFLRQSDKVEVEGEYKIKEITDSDTYVLLFETNGVISKGFIDSRILQNTKTVITFTWIFTQGNSDIWVKFDKMD